MTILCWILFLLFESCLISGDDFECNYFVNKSDNTFDVCMNHKCHEFIDPYSIMVRPNHCKTTYFSLTFSTYKKFHSFRNHIPWKLGDLFPSKMIENQIRQLRIYIKQIDFDDRPIDEKELNRLGSNIDLCQLYLQNITPSNYLYQLIHYDPNDSQWDIVQIQFQCHALMRLDENLCSTQIIPPPFLARRRPSSTAELLLTTTTTLSSTSSPSTERSKEQNDSRSIHLIILILIPFFILLVTLLIAVIVYMRKRSSNRDLTSITPRSSSIPSISNNLDSKNESCSECRPTIQPYQVSRLPSPHIDSLYKEPERTRRMNS